VTLWFAAERWSLIGAAYPEAALSPRLQLSDDFLKPVESGDAVHDLIRGRLGVTGPVTAGALAGTLGLDRPAVEAALARLELEGLVLQGRYTAEGTKPGSEIEWCDRRLLARIHRLTMDGLRRSFQPVPPETYWRYLADYHHLAPNAHRDGLLGLREAVGQLQGFEMPAGAWEPDVLAHRVDDYRPEQVDQLSYAGELVWGRLHPPGAAGDEESARAMLSRVVPISLAFRDDLPWLLPPGRESSEARARSEARRVYQTLRERGALFTHDLAQWTGLLDSRIEDALSELAAWGLVTADGFGALRAIVAPRRSESTRQRSQRRARAPFGGGRWTLFPGRLPPVSPDDRLRSWATQLLRRYGIVFRDLLTRETVAPAWWELVPIYRRMEARGEIRGGRFVAGVAGEQYAFPEAVEALRRPRDDEESWLVISAADPLNLVGVVLPGTRVPATRGNRLLLHNGRLAATYQAGEVQILERASESDADKMSRALRLTQLPQLREDLLQELAQGAQKR